MGEHSYCSPSSLKRRSLCSASCREEAGIEEDGDDENSARGIRLHKLMEYMAKGRLNLDSLSEDERSAVSKAWKMALNFLGDEILPDGTTANGGRWFCEVRMDALTSSANGWRDWGTADLVVIYEREKRIVILDWKFGGAMIDHPQFNLQLKDYAIMAWDKFGWGFSIEVGYIQPASSEMYECQPWVWTPEDGHRIAASIKEIRERSYGNDVEYVVGPACDQCAAAKKGTCWARQQVFGRINMLAGLTEASRLDPVALGRAIDAAQVIHTESDRLWKLLKSEAMKRGADGWVAKPEQNRIYRTVSKRDRISHPDHLTNKDSGDKLI